MFVRILILLSAFTASIFAEWRQFRGPTGDGTYPPREDGKPHGFPTEWSEEKNVVWKTPVKGIAWSTPVVMDNEVWVSNATPDGKKMFGVCLDKASGKIIHNLLLFENPDPEPLSNKVNGYGSCSPTIDEEHVYFHFGSYGTTALDRKSGKKVWERRDLPCRHFRGPGSSVILHKDLLMLTMDGIDVQYVAALNRKTGETVWKTPRTVDFGDVEEGGKIRGDGDFRKAYSTPNLIKIGNQTQLVSPGAKACYGYDADSGKELWKVQYNGYSNAASPVFIGKEMAIINTGFGKAHLLGVRFDDELSGDITHSHVEWDIFKRIPTRSSPLVVDRMIYVTADNGVLSRIDPSDGEIKDSLPLRGNFSASGVYADGLLYFFDENGKTSVVKPGKKMELVATSQLDDGYMASPALDSGTFYLRTKTSVYRIGKK